LSVSVSMLPVKPAPSLVNFPMIAITCSPFRVVEAALCVLAYGAERARGTAGKS
jgi:hypothetical protein